MDPLDRPLSDLIGHRLEIATHCGCTKVSVVGPVWLMERMGQNVTLRIAASRMICRTCKQRPELVVERDWGSSEGRDGRPNPPPLPEWVVPLVR